MIAGTGSYAHTNTDGAKKNGWRKVEETEEEELLKTNSGRGGGKFSSNSYATTTSEFMEEKTSITKPKFSETNYYVDGGKDSGNDSMHTNTSTGK